MKVTSLEISKQLKEAGFPQETHFYYGQLKGNEAKLVTKDFLTDITAVIYGAGMIEVYAAPTADEVLDQLPARVEGSKGGAFICVERYDEDHTYEVGYRYHIDFRPFYSLSFRADCLADAAAKAWLYLKKEGIL